ncbi:hypothetical protein [Bacillus xiapuensis]|uniref:Uncharacterized protein n=1 Tax=Bacillus xiapuensis TaxID=2014075 RepID=A0ABU6NAH9_9BACI|nr:hypothetical protein [Bacillus xiapuensis]
MFRILIFQALFSLAVLIVIVNYLIMLIGAEGTKTPVGVRGRGDPTGAKRRGGSRTSHGKRSARSGNKQPNLTQPYKK